MSDYADFLAAMIGMAPEGSRVLLNQFPGDPNSDVAEKWRVFPLRDIDQIEPRQNVYVTLSAFGKLDGKFRRKMEVFAAALAFVIDDLGTKVPLELIERLPPTLLVETSPGNFQAAYLFKQPVTQIGVFDELVNAFVLTHCGGVDPGMKGVNRVWRPGIGINGKAKYKTDGKAFQVRVAASNLEARYTVSDLTKAFGLQMRPPRRAKLPNTTSGEIAERIEHFVRVVELLKRQGLMEKHADDRLDTWIDSGWIYITCPWIDHHTDRANTGTAIRGPAPLGVDESGKTVGNDWHGAFKCYHGHCEGKGWAELTDHLIDLAMENINERF